MRVFHYDNDGLFIGESRAEIDPMETRKQKKAIYLIPGGATTTPPPRKVLEQDHIWKFYGESWIEVIDQEAKALSEKIEREAQEAIELAEKEAQEAIELAEKVAAEKADQEQNRIELEQILEAQEQKKAQLESRLNAIKDRTGVNIADLNEDLKAIADILLEKL